MALCCIGGVCVPYSAIVPLVVLGLKWLLERLVMWGLIPLAWVESLNRLISGNPAATSRSRDTTAGANKSPPLAQESSCCSSNGSSSTSFENQDTGKDFVRPIDSEDDWEALLKQSHSVPVVVKFTAGWCQPCKKIQPFYCSLAAETHSRVAFATVDVDDLDRVAAEHRIAILPTFAVFQMGQLVRRYTGSDEARLTDFVRQDDPQS